MPLLTDINIKQIDWNDTFFKIGFELPKEELKKSIQTYGILNPPILQKNDQNKYRIICGFKRLEIAKNSGLKNITAFIAEDTKSLFELFNMALYENLSIRNFNIIEKAQVFFILNNYFKISEEEIIKKYQDVFSFGSNNVWFKWLKILKNLPRQIQVLFEQNLLSHDLLDFLEDLENEEKFILVQIVKDFNLGKNRQKELVFLLHDIILIKKITLKELYNFSAIVEIRTNSKPTQSQKVDKLFSCLHSLRYPVYTRALKQFKQWLLSLKLPKEVQVKHGPYFETNKIDFSFQVSNSKELENIIKQLEQIDGKKFDSLNDMLSEALKENDI